MAKKSEDPGPSVKDPEMYEALHEDGASKEKAARIANAAARTSRSEVGRKLMQRPAPWASMAAPP